MKNSLSNRNNESEIIYITCEGRQDAESLGRNAKPSFESNKSFSKNKEKVELKENKDPNGEELKQNSEKLPNKNVKTSKASGTSQQPI